MRKKGLLPAWVRGSMAMIVIVTAVPATSIAQPSPDVRTPAGNVPVSAVKVTWADIVEVVDRHPQMGVARHNMAAARAAVDAAGAVPNPSIEAIAAHGEAIDGSASRVEWGLGLSIPLGWIATRGAMVDAAEAEARVADAEANALRRDVLLQLRVLFWNLVYEQERVAALDELNEQTRALANTVKRRVEQGEVRPVEATRVEVEAETIAGELDAAKSALVARGAQLAAWLGADRQLVAAADLMDLPGPVPAMDARDKARTEHPAVLAATARVQALTAAVSVERLARVPSVALEAFVDHELDRRAYGVGLAIDLPVWNWNTGNIQRSESILAAGRMRLELERLELDTAAVDAQAACQAGVKVAIRYRDRIQPRAESVAQTIERTYQLGEATLLEVIDARRTLLETKRKFLDTLVQAQTDCSRLRSLTGEESP